MLAKEASQRQHRWSTASRLQEQAVRPPERTTTGIGSLRREGACGLTGPRSCLRGVKAGPCLRKARHSPSALIQLG
jgi:hypothetical protein